MRKPAFCICENKDADQLRGHRAADQRLNFRYIYSAIPLLPKSEIFSHLLWLYSPVRVGSGRKPRRRCFLTTRLTRDILIRARKTISQPFLAIIVPCVLYKRIIQMRMRSHRERLHIGTLVKLIVCFHTSLL